MPRDFEALLRKHLPVLAIFPQDPALKWPGSDKGPWGDYHPCSVEFFLDRSRVREDAGRDGYFPDVAAMREALAAIPDNQVAEATKDWEINLGVRDAARVLNDPEKVWQDYSNLVNGPAGVPFVPRTYGRFFEEGEDIALQYWYLYAYNDFRNSHEGDWEMVTISLDPRTEAPLQLRSSAHQGNYQCKWHEPYLLKASDTGVDADGTRPIIHVGRGSHSGFHAYGDGTRSSIEAMRCATLPDEKDLADVMMDILDGLNVEGETAEKLRSALKRLAIEAKVRELVDRAVDTAIQLVPELGIIREYIPAVKGVDKAGEMACGQLLFFDGTDGDLKIMPPGLDDTKVVDTDGDWWWMRYFGRWGALTRVFGFSVPGMVGPPGPWTAPDLRWEFPPGWVRGDPWDTDGKTR